jgi:hypothetical protein
MKAWHEVGSWQSAVGSSDPGISSDPVTNVSQSFRLSVSQSLRLPHSSLLTTLNFYI